MFFTRSIGENESGTENDVSIYNFDATTIDGEEISLSRYKGNVLLIVNVASYCGYTKHYKGLEELFRKYKDRGFAVLGFPCNQFGKQEPRTNEEIKNFCKTNYDVTFPLFSKIEVNGENAHPLYKFLRAKTTGFAPDTIKWNFTKFLVSRNGNNIIRYGHRTEPDSLAPDIEKYLESK